MKTLKNKIAAITIAILFILSMTSSMMLIPNASAHTPAWQIPTYSFISISPNPIGLGQPANVNFWVNMPPPTAGAQFGDRWHNMTVKVTKPDGTTQTLGPFTSWASGGMYTTYTPNVIGNYTFQMSFGGQTLAGDNLPPGIDPSSIPNIGDYYQPSTSNIFKLTVQQEQIGYPPVTSLPTTYWTRPIYGENNNWNIIGGNWLGLGRSTCASAGMYNASTNYNPYTTAPNTAHILWTKPEAFGGIIGGEFGNSETANFYSTGPYEPKFAPIIMNGILYYTMYPGSSTNPAGWAAVDLQTGQTLWTKNTTEVLVGGQILDLQTPNQYGALAYLWSTPTKKGTSLEMWDAMTGNYILTIKGSPKLGGGSLTEDEHGDLIYYYVNYNDNTLNMWNSTRCINLASGGAIYGSGPSLADSWDWRPPQNAQINFTLGIQWSAPLATEISGNPLIDYDNDLYGLDLVGVESGVALLIDVPMHMSDYMIVFGYTPGWQIEAGYSTTDGSQLWITNRTETPYSIIVMGGNANYGLFTMGSGVCVEITQSTLSAIGYSLTTGKQLWGPTALPNASPFASLGLNGVVANGTIYIWTYGGDVYAFNIVTGELKWQYHTPPGGYESPYGVEPIWTFTVGTVADGKLFLPEGHQYSPPLFHNAQQLALNITDGSVVWSIDAFDVTSAPAISDGIATTLNAYDNQIYAYGMGPSKTTVTAPDPVTSVGSPMVIRGTVTDISAGSQQEAQAANFPNGLPCVSDASMTPFMEAVYMQQTMPTNTTGVPVTISVLDSNGNYRQIGTTTSNADGMFTLTWTPDIPGNYTVVANFAGSESYYPSHADTSFYASPAPAATATPTPTPASMADQYFLPVSIGIIIAIVIVVALLALVLLMLRKRP